MSLCTSKYYARMDADDIMCITRIEQQVRFMETHPNVLVCGSSIMTIDNKNNIIGSRYRDGIVESFFIQLFLGVLNGLEIILILAGLYEPKIWSCGYVLLLIVFFIQLTNHFFLSRIWYSYF